MPESHKPAYDEQTLARVLEAAYVMQEHNRKRQKKDSGSTLSAEQLVAQIAAAERSISANFSQLQDAEPQPRINSTISAAAADTTIANNPRGSAPSVVAQSAVAPAPTFPCKKCGHKLLEREQFCGNCGTPRVTKFEPPVVQPTIAPAEAKVSQQPPARVAPASEPLVPPVGDTDLADFQDVDTSINFSPEQVIEPYAKAAHSGEEAAREIERHIKDFEMSSHAELEVQPDAGSKNEEEASEGAASAPTTALAKPERSLTWRSAASTREFLEQLVAARNSGSWSQLWSTHRGDVYLALAIVLVLAVIRWGISEHTVNATGKPTVSAHRKAAPDAELPLFERILVKVGLAELPDPPDNKGNPRIQVWEDLHTALYYCPGDDQYGKTPKGKFSSQRDAQLDQFEPAYRKACE